MHEAHAANVLNALLPDAESIERKGDIESCRTFISMLNLQDFERFVEKGRVSALDTAIDRHYAQFHNFLRSIHFHISSPTLLERFFELDEAWSDALSFDNWFIGIPDTSLLRFRKPHECPPGSHAEHAREEFLHAVEMANSSLKSLLACIHHQYPELGTENLASQP